MITIFKNKKDIPHDKEYIQMIDCSELLSKYKIRSRFENITLNTDQLSTGCKIVLNVLYFPDKVFCLKECEYSCAATPQIRQTGNRLSGLAETAYASLLAQCFV